MPVTARSLLALFNREIRRPVSVAELVSELGLGEAERGAVQEALRELTLSGEIVRIKGGRFGLAHKMNLVVGRLSCSPKGYGFVTPERGGTDVFVRITQMSSALHGDEVVARVEHLKPDGRLAGSIIRVLDRANKRLLGRYERGPACAWVVPVEPRILTQLIVAPDDTLSAREGQLVEAEIMEYPGLNRQATGRIVAVVGETEDPAVDLELVLRRHDLPREFPARVLRAARTLALEPQAEEVVRRRDFRDDPVVTIDGERARDFDDAISVERRSDGGFRLQVHIADVSHYVRPGDPVDKEARSRATSIYFPDHVIPMLPAELSNGVCSLKPRVERLTLSLVIEIDRQGAVEQTSFFEGVICSRERLTYEEVHTLLVDRDPELLRRLGTTADMLDAAFELSRILAGVRAERGSMEFDLPESEIVLSVAGEMTGIKRARHLVSHQLIEEFMILANEVVAQHFVTVDEPSIYRIHEGPNPAEVEELNQTLRFFGYEVEALSPKSFRALMDKVRGRPEERFVNTVALRTMKLARYDSANHGHFGLASTAYTHFTSPIRRYPDLILHRRLRERMRGGQLAADRREGLRAELEIDCTHCSQLERRAEDAEREYIERKKARFMAGRVGESFHGIVAAVQSFGFFVELEEYFVEGLVHLTSLHDDYYRFDEQKHELLGESAGRRFRLGDRVEVVVSHVDMVRRRIDFVLAAASGEVPRPRSQRPLTSRGTRRKSRGQ